MSAGRPAGTLAEVFAGLDPLTAVAGGRMGGKRKALNEAVEKLIRAGWTEVSGDPECGGPRAKGIRMFRAPTGEPWDAKSAECESTVNPLRVHLVL